MPIKVKFLLLVLAASLAAPSAFAVPLPTPDQILTELNRARADPHAYAEALRAYRRDYDGLVVRTSPDDVGLLTNEGASAVDEAIGFLEHEPPLVTVSLAAPLSRSADAHARDQSRTGGLGHTGSDGSSFNQRIAREGSWQGEAAEAIAYGHDTAADVVRQLIIDDGVPSRGHRQILFDPVLRNVGIACAPHPTYGEVCVLDFATAVIEKKKR